MTDRPVYVAHDLSDLLNTVPAVLGFHPTESLVAIATYGARRRFGFSMRVDLPPVEHVDAVAAHVVGHLRRQHADGAVVLAIAQDQAVARELTSAVEHGLGEIQPIAVARADGARYWVDVPGFPSEGIAYEASAHHRAIVEAVVAGQEILPDRAALVERWSAVAGERRVAMTEACDRVQRHVVGVLTGQRSASTRGIVELAPVLASIEAGRSLSDAEVALLCVWVGASEVRDHVWERIDATTARCYLPALLHASRSVVPPHEPAVLCLGAFAAWMTGDGAQAVIAAERARSADPEHVMASLVLDLVGAGIPPGEWHRRSDVA